MEFGDNKPIYLQIADSIMDSIIRGEYKAGDRLPSVRDYAVNTGVNPNTVQRTFTWLQTQSFINMRRGIGYFVDDSAAARILDARRKNFLEHEANYFLERLATIGVTPEQLKQDYENYLRNSKR